MENIRWGIIGCGDVTEVKSGPAFNKVKNSSLHAVMRRNADKAKDYAKRHGVSRWYIDATELIRDPGVNAVYIATPPSTHEKYTIEALEAGKPVYVEKPMSLNADSAQRMKQAADEHAQKLVVAHYRRAQPFFQKIKQWVDEGQVGDVQIMRSTILKRPLTKEELAIDKTAWRVDPNLAGGGLFHDLAPHQLDLAIYFFGEVAAASGFAGNRGGLYEADDLVTGNILFKNGAQFSGTWSFNVAPADERDRCEIIGTRGRIVFSFFDPCPALLYQDGKKIEHAFEVLQHVQQPMIEKVVEHFLGNGPNPCSADYGIAVMKLIDQFTNR